MQLRTKSNCPINCHFIKIAAISILLIIFSGGISLGAGGTYQIYSGDFNHDNIVDYNDLGTFAMHWLENPCNDANHCGHADIDDSNLVDLLDFVLLANDWLKSPNLCPFVDAGTDQVITYPVNYTNLNGTVTDDYQPNPPLTLNARWTLLSGPNDVYFSDVNNVNTTVQFSAYGIYVLRLSGDDGAVISYDDLTVTYQQAVAENQAPSVNAGNDDTITYPVTSVNLDGTVTDDDLPNPPALTAHWTLASGPGDVLFDDPNMIDTTASFSINGTYVMRLTADDGLLTAFDEVTITYVGLPLWSQAADFYVDGRVGNDSYSGNSIWPYKTIAKAASLASAGKTILVWGNQTYTEQVSFAFSGTSGSPITCKRDTASGQAVIFGNGSNYPIYSNGKSYIVIDGFTVTNGLYGVYINGDSADYVTIQNCRITANMQHGICINAADNCTLHNNAVYLNGTAHNGIYAYSGASGQTITQCVIYKQKYGVQTTQSSSSATVRNCIITNNTTYGLYKAMGMGSISSSYCDVWSNGTNYSGCSTGTGSISTNPPFVDPDNGDFHLQTGSSCIGSASDGGNMGYRYDNSAI